MKNALKLSGLILIAVLGLFFIDPAFSRTKNFAEFSTVYDYRIFNNSFCNWKSKGHCPNNNFNELNADRRLWLTLAENYKGESSIKEKLENVVLSHYHFHMIYTEHLKIAEINIDSIVKHREELFEPLFID